MTDTTTYSIIVVAGHHDVGLTLVASVWHPHRQMIRRNLEHVECSWQNSMGAARTLVHHALAMAADEHLAARAAMKRHADEVAPHPPGGGSRGVGPATL